MLPRSVRGRERRCGRAVDAGVCTGAWRTGRPGTLGPQYRRRDRVDNGLLGILEGFFFNDLLLRSFGGQGPGLKPGKGINYKQPPPYFPHLFSLLSPFSPFTSLSGLSFLFFSLLFFLSLSLPPCFSHIVPSVFLPSGYLFESLLYLFKSPCHVKGGKRSGPSVLKDSPPLRVSLRCQLLTNK